MRHGKMNKPGSVPMNTAAGRRWRKRLGHHRERVELRAEIARIQREVDVSLHTLDVSPYHTCTWD